MRCGKSAYSWKTSPTRRSSGRRSIRSAVSSQTSSPSATRPERGRTSPATTRSVDVLPAPDGPTSATVPSTSRLSSRSKARSGREKSAREGCHCRTSLIVMRSDGAHEHEQRADRERDSEVHVELRVDGERQRLRHPAQAPGEHDRRAELAEAPRKGKRLAGREPAAGERQDDAEERLHGTGTERARRGDEVRVDLLESGDRLAHVERARDERDRERHRALRERQARVQEEPRPRPKAASSPIPATAGGSTSGSSTSVTSTERPESGGSRAHTQWGVPRARMSACATSVVFRLTTSASVTTGFESCAAKLPRRHVREDGDDRQREECKRDEGRGEDEPREQSSPHHFVRLHTRQEAGREELRLAGLAHDRIDEGLRRRSVRAALRRRRFRTAPSVAPTPAS